MDETTTYTVLLSGLSEFDFVIFGQRIAVFTLFANIIYPVDGRTVA